MALVMVIGDMDMEMKVIGGGGRHKGGYDRG
jgi:hypothetical protein